MSEALLLTGPTTSHSHKHSHTLKRRPLSPRGTCRRSPSLQGWAPSHLGPPPFPSFYYSSQDSLTVNKRVGEGWQTPPSLLFQCLLHLLLHLPPFPPPTLPPPPSLLGGARVEKPSSPLTHPSSLLETVFLNLKRAGLVSNPHISTQV